jgi:hypothetical protein
LINCGLHITMTMTICQITVLMLEKVWRMEMIFIARGQLGHLLKNAASSRAQSQLLLNSVPYKLFSNSLTQFNMHWLCDF